MNGLEVENDTGTSVLQAFFARRRKEQNVAVNSKGTSAHSGLDVTSICKNKFLSDFSILCDMGQLIYAHKVVLAMSSPVFKRMLEMDCKESADCVVKIMDFKFDVVEQMIIFLYTGDAPKMNTMAENLLKIAEKYEILRLKRECEDAIISNLSIDTALYLLALADMNNATELEHATIEFIKRHFKAIRGSTDWKFLSKRLLEKLLDNAMK